MSNLFAYIPAPPTNSIGFIRIYGITMALGIGIATLIAHRRYSAKHNGSQLVVEMFLPTVIAGIIGARVYHLFTGYDWDAGGIAGTIKLRNGGLSIWGAVFAGAVAVFIQARIKKVSFIELADAIVPGIAVGQAIGRCGNYFNQELFGRPTKLPWGLQVDELYRPIGDAAKLTYHPTFLYEALWCLALAAAIIFAEKRFSVWSSGASLAAYVALYCAGRSFCEWLRVDAASEVFGIRFNLLLSLVLTVLGAVALLMLLTKNHKVRTQAVAQ